MARKTITLPSGIYHSPNDTSILKEVRRELVILQTCRSESIVRFFGASVDVDEIGIYMEFMDVGSLDQVYKTFGPICVEVLGRIAVAALEAVIYLYHNHRIIHRDLKPSNILVNSCGEIKVCDFGVAGEAVNSVANTFIGTSGYMSPERIRGGKHSSQSDSWSLGITLLELANGGLPFPTELSIFELLAFVLEEDLPRLWSGDESFGEFLDKCLIKDPDVRPTPARLMHHAFILASKESHVDLASWAKSLL